MGRQETILDGVKRLQAIGVNMPTVDIEIAKPPSWNQSLSRVLFEVGTLAFGFNIAGKMNAVDTMIYIAGLQAIRTTPGGVAILAELGKWSKEYQQTIETGVYVSPI